MNLGEVKRRIEFSSLQPSTVDPAAPLARDVIDRLFPDAYTIENQDLGISKGAHRFLVVVDVDGNQFGWLEDRIPRGATVFVRWVWAVEKVEPPGAAPFWAVDDE